MKDHRNTLKNILCCGALALAALLTSGCATGRRIVDVPLPDVPVPANVAQRGTAVIMTRDVRVFEKDPRQPSIPSAAGNLNMLSDTTKNNLIGRQRNTYGAALGEVALQPGGSVQDRTSALIAKELTARGYTVVADPAQAGTKLDVSVEEFWGWITPGMWTLSIEARIRCQIKLSRAGKEAVITASGYAIHHPQTGSQANWEKGYRLAYENFLQDLRSKLNSAGF
ncbi:MAG: hypothetical protein LBR07_00165 [Puniceicoccales bacterium]|jgi:uncharacterized lipoprotein YajG|nr:hypothetical protein [Puniceicoccales bacterium]